MSAFRRRAASVAASASVSSPRKRLGQLAAEPLDAVDRARRRGADRRPGGPHRRSHRHAGNDRPRPGRDRHRRPGPRCARRRPLPATSRRWSSSPPATRCSRPPTMPASCPAPTRASAASPPACSTRAHVVSFDADPDVDRSGPGGPRHRRRRARGPCRPAPGVRPPTGPRSGRARRGSRRRSGCCARANPTGAPRSGTRWSPAMVATSTAFRPAVVSSRRRRAGSCSWKGSGGGSMGGPSNDGTTAWTAPTKKPRNSISRTR